MTDIAVVVNISWCIQKYAGSNFPSRQSGSAVGLTEELPVHCVISIILQELLQYITLK